jgi:hypothetical protein
MVGQNIMVAAMYGGDCSPHGQQDAERGKVQGPGAAFRGMTPGPAASWTVPQFGSVFNI